MVQALAKKLKHTGPAEKEKMATGRPFGKNVRANHNISTVKFGFGTSSTSAQFFWSRQYSYVLRIFKFVYLHRLYQHFSDIGTPLLSPKVFSSFISAFSLYLPTVIAAMS